MDGTITQGASIAFQVVSFLVSGILVPLDVIYLLAFLKRLPYYHIQLNRRVFLTQYASIVAGSVSSVLACTSLFTTNEQACHWVVFFVSSGYGSVNLSLYVLL